MSPERNFTYGLKIAITAMLLILMIGFVGKRQQDRVVPKVMVNIENQQGNFFIQDQDILMLINQTEQPYIVGAEMSQISLKKIENSVKSHKFVESAQVYRDLEGNLIIDVKQCLPVARIMRKNGKDHYLTDKGEIIPVSDRYTARVMILEGSYFGDLDKNNIIEFDKGQEILDMLHFISSDKFWKAQIAHIRLDAKGNMVFYPQVSKQYVEFGTCDNFEDKFRKLRIFYEKILPHKGWNTYARVNVSYKGQIVCE